MYLIRCFEVLEKLSCQTAYIYIYIYIYIWVCVCVCACVRVCIYLCISNTFQRSYEIFFSHANFCRIQIYFVFFRLSLYIYCLVTPICHTKVADKKSFEWKMQSPKYISYENEITFSSCSVDKTERNSSGIAKGKDNGCTKVSISIKESVWGYNGIYA